MRYRELYCIPKYVNGTDQLWRHMVDVVHCKDHEIPTQTEECNRFPCPSYWEETDWTECSATCGLGMKTLRYECSAPQTHMCGLYPLQRSICSLEQCPRVVEPDCSGDLSPLCAEEVGTK